MMKNMDFIYNFTGCLGSPFFNGATMARKINGETTQKSVSFEDKVFDRVKELMENEGNNFSFMINEILKRGFKNLDHEKIIDRNIQLAEEVEWLELEINDLKKDMKMINNISKREE